MSSLPFQYITATNVMSEWNSPKRKSSKEMILQGGDGIASHCWKYIVGALSCLLQPTSGALHFGVLLYIMISGKFLRFSFHLHLHRVEFLFKICSFRICFPAVLPPADLWYLSWFPRYRHPDFLWRCRGIAYSSSWIYIGCPNAKYCVSHIYTGCF